MTNEPSVGVVLITHTAVDHLPRCLPPYLESRLRPRVLVVNSSSNDGTVERARELGAETLVIPRAEFNHGATREVARRQLRTDIVVCATPDAYPVAGRDIVETLTRPLRAGEAEVAYARQLPHVGAGIFEAFPRAYNYPATGHTRSIADVAKHGVYTFFCSNSCAAWDNRALDRVGGFPTVLTNEDYFAVAAILAGGGRVAYVADAEVHHSHGYSLKAEFTRYFDTGLVRGENRWIQEMVGTAYGRGAGQTSAMLRAIARERPALIPYALAQTVAKLAGYRLGLAGARFPYSLKRRLSGQDYYWSSVHAATGGRVPRPAGHGGLSQLA